MRAYYVKCHAKDPASIGSAFIYDTYHTYGKIEEAPSDSEEERIRLRTPKC